MLEIRPDFKQAQTERGKIYIKQGKYDLAEEDFKHDAAKRNEIQVIFLSGFVFIILFRL